MGGGAQAVVRGGVTAPLAPPPLATALFQMFVYLRNVRTLAFKSCLLTVLLEVCFRFSYLLYAISS